MSDKRIEFAITLEFSVPVPFERKTTLTDQQVIDKVLEYIEDESTAPS